MAKTNLHKTNMLFFEKQTQVPIYVDMDPHLCVCAGCRIYFLFTLHKWQKQIGIKNYTIRTSNMKN